MPSSDAPTPFVVRSGEVNGYSPANHTGTVNRRLIGPETVGAKQLEVLRGTLAPGNGALPHRHPGIEQVCYILSGTARAEVSDRTEDLGPGDACFFAADVEHVFTVTSKEPAEIIVIYSPPYGEDSEKTIIRSAAAKATNE
jgi:mannose-6-phosphate isomerase-like protein (cupin superfamily)